MALQSAESRKQVDHLGGLVKFLTKCKVFFISACKILQYSRSNLLIYKCHFLDTFEINLDNLDTSKNHY